MERVGYSSPFVPAEWIRAHGFRPSRIPPSPSSADGFDIPRAGACPYARAFVQHVGEDETIRVAVMTTTCDQMRRMADVLARRVKMPVFLMHVPATWETREAGRFYKKELKRLGTFLADLGGRTPTETAIAQAARKYDDARSALRALAAVLPARRFAQALADFHERGAADCRLTPNSHHIKLSRLQGARHFEVFDWIEQAGGRVALNATESGERTLPAPLDRRRLNRDPLEALVEAYFGAIPDAFRRPDSRLHEWLQKEFAERAIRGVVFVQHTWCDLWRAAAPRIREWSGLPMATVEIGDGGELNGHSASRIQALLEAIR
ncbi:MAG: 2-hydroxyacyl-CoA dehydratase family protein [Candidatus Sumerlaeota bacterium]|nr:2-hydroxyacyl-CoA dehydratase family protein [Candidatus Sumerlaeota bacterium]